MAGFSWRGHASCAGCFSMSPKYYMDTATKVLLALASIEWALMLAAAALILTYDVEHHLSQDASVVYASLSIFVVIAHCGFTVDALMSENSFQFLASQVVGALETLMICYFVFFHPSTLGIEWKHDLRWIMFAVRCFMQIVYIALAWPVLQSFGSTEYWLGANTPQLQSLYRGFKAWLSMLKVDGVVFLFLLLLAKSFLLSTTSVEFIGGVVAAVLSLPWAYAMWWGVVQESPCIVRALGCLSVLQPVWVVYKLVNLGLHPDRLPQQVTYGQFLTTGVLFLGCRVTTLYLTHRVYLTFGHGLKDQIFNKADAPRAVSALPSPHAPLLQEQEEHVAPAARSRLEEMYRQQMLADEQAAGSVNGQPQEGATAPQTRMQRMMAAV